MRSRVGEYAHVLRKRSEGEGHGVDVELPRTDIYAERNLGVSANMTTGNVLRWL